MTSAPVITVGEIDALIAKLEAWRENDFHADRQLADEVLIADGWICVPDPEWEGGIRWSWGTSPRYSTSERGRPHPVIDLNTAIGVVPRGFDYHLSRFGDQHFASVFRRGAPVSAGLARDEHDGSSPSPCLAILIAAFKAIRASRSK